MNDVECVNGVADVTNTGVSLVRSYNFIKVIVILLIWYNLCPVFIQMNIHVLCSCTGHYDLNVWEFF